MTSTPSDPMPEQGATPPPPPEGAVPPPSYQAPPPAYNAPPPGYQAPPPGYAAPPPGYAAPAAPLTDAEQRQWAMFAHLGGILFAFVPSLVIWLVFKARGRFVEEQAKEALNFQITMAIAGVVVFILTLLTLGIASLLYFVLWVVILVFCILAGMAANKGQAYRYPVTIRIVK